MSPGSSRLLRALFYVYVAVTFLHVAYVVNHEPFAFDAWNVSVDTHAKPASIGRFFEFWHQQYTTSNPRLGQPLAYLAYKLVGVGEVGTALAFFAIVVGGFVLGNRRWPSLRDGRDLATLAIGIGAMWFVAPDLPAHMFCRAYATNYIWAAAIQLWFLVPLLLHDPAAPRPSAPRLAAYFLLGIAAGMCNEHTGPTLVAFLVAWGAWSWRRHGRRPALLWTGIAGSAIGYAIIFFAPGQSQRYEGVAEKFSATQQVLVRGFAGNIDIYLDMLGSAAPILVVALVAIALGLVTENRAEADLGDVRARQRRATGFLAIAMLAATTIAITIFASPKLGPRLHIHSMLFLLAAVLGLLPAFLHRTRAFAPFVIFAVVASGYAMARTIPAYTKLARESDRRLAALAATPHGGVYTAEAWDQINENWWMLGDDARDQAKRGMIATYFDLDRVVFRGGEAWKPLGVSDLKLTMHYELDNPMCLDELDDLEIKPWLGRDVGAIHHAFLDVITEVHKVSKTHIKKIDLTATFLGSPPPLPRKKLYVARWADGVLEGYVANIKRSGRSSLRQIVLPPEMKKSDWEIYALAIGDEPRRLGTSAEQVGYEPWRTGTYWILACKPDYCFVVFSATHVVL